MTRIRSTLAAAVGLAALAAASQASAQTAPAPAASTAAQVQISDAECQRLLADPNATVTAPPPETVPVWDVGATPAPAPSASASPAPDASPSAAATPDPNASATPAPTASATPGTVFGPSSPVVQPLPVSAPTTTAPSAPASSDDVPYMDNPSIARMKVTSAVETLGGSAQLVHYYRASSIDPAYQQDLDEVKSYPTPSGDGVLRSIGGQAILTKDSHTNISGLSDGIVAVVDEINITANELGLPSPVVTAGHDTSGHHAGSDHYTGNALDLRCNAVGESACKQWVVTLQNAIGSDYDVVFEDWDGANDHVHVSYKG